MLFVGNCALTTEDLISLFQSYCVWVSLNVIVQKASMWTCWTAVRCQDANLHCSMSVGLLHQLDKAWVPHSPALRWHFRTSFSTAFCMSSKSLMGLFLWLPSRPGHFSQECVCSFLVSLDLQWSMSQCRNEDVLVTGSSQCSILIEESEAAKI